MKLNLLDFYNLLGFETITITIRQPEMTVKFTSWKEASSFHGEVSSTTRPDLPSEGKTVSLEMKSENGLVVRGMNLGK